MSERMYQGIIGVLVLVILVGGAIMVSYRGPEPSTVELTESTSTTAQSAVGAQSANNASASKQTTASAQSPSANTTVSAGSDSVSVDDQPAGASVAISDVSLAKDGWVAIQSEGWTLGAAWFPAGDHKNVTVPLLRATTAGLAYKAVLYYDTPDDHIFDLHKDTVLTRPDGSQLSAAFLAK